MKKLHELNNNELLAVWRNNSKLREVVFEERIVMANDWINEYLSCFNRATIRYNITDTKQYSFIEVLDLDEFIEGLEKFNKFYGLSDDSNKQMEQIKKILNFIYEMEEVLDIETINALYMDVEKLYKPLIDELLTIMCHEYEFCYNDAELQYYFVNFMLDDLIESNHYYLDDGYILYKHIEQSFK